jgi:hypothetical protein
MKKLPAVEEARVIMKQGMEWPVWKWLLQKKHVRIIADKAVEAFDEVEANVKAAWSDELKIAYNNLVAEDEKPARRNGKSKAAKKEGAPLDAQTVTAIEKVKEADEIAYDARMDAEDLFEEAEKRLSISITKQGAAKALESYDLREVAIRKAEGLLPTK